MDVSVAPGLTPDLFRDATSRFATGVTVVTTRTAEGSLIGITANSFSSVSLDPPLVLFSLARHAYSLPVFETATAYVINILSGSQQMLALRFARAGADKWQDVPFSEGIDGCPRLQGTLACIECRPYANYDGGDHRIFVGQTSRITRNDETWPLLFYRRSFHEIGSPLRPASPAT